MRELIPMKDLHTELSRAFDLFHDRFFQDFDGIFGTSGSLLHTLGQSEYPKTNVLQKGQDIIFEVSVPQYNPHDVEVFLQGDVLTIKGKATTANTSDERYLLRELSQRSFVRSWRLPVETHEENIEASYDRGMLRLVVKNVLPKVDEPKTRKIEIKKLSEDTKN